MTRRRRLAATLGAAAALAAAGHALFRRFAVVEASMRPGIEPGDWIIGRRWGGTPTRGDIVVFGHSSAAQRSLVKRIVGLPNERIDIARGHVQVNGIVLAEPWVIGATSPEGTWWVPPGHVWVLGDNRPASTADSRDVGPIPIAALRWKILARYWPPARAGRL